ncbi:formyltetrahydrofolate deformylase [Arenicella chitinivorans]|uniref:Formyltetrahydrofolate deformylase n=1 Tax=Arenicella chitinivorans TaxID=1329800 RepID=A0A918RNY6_9GAMM|nr:formyltetrahydrofolate deformylase [Arenicella chitinivorans]GHA07325.1 formyltetrahydrofolate deformylase [Arenicella chitinivorans]
MVSPSSDNPAIAALLFSCIDAVGIIADLANFFAERGLNISRYEEYTDDGHFFSRLEWPLNDRWEDEAAFDKEFASMAQRYQANFDVRFMNQQQSIGLFVSRQPHALIEILNKYEANYFPNIEVSFILGNHESMRRIADRHGLPFFHVPTDGEVPAYERKQLDIVHRYKPDFIGLARYMKVLSEDFIDRAGCPIVNIHHSFLPSFVGAKPYQMAYDRGVKLIGATSHFVTAELDQGPIIEQDVARVVAGASVQDMVKMGRDVEQKVFARAMLKVLEHKAIVHKNRTIIFN